MHQIAFSQPVRAPAKFPRIPHPQHNYRYRYDYIIRSTRLTSYASRSDPIPSRVRAVASPSRYESNPSRAIERIDYQNDYVRSDEDFSNRDCGFRQRAAFYVCYSYEMVIFCESSRFKRVSMFAPV